MTLPNEALVDDNNDDDDDGADANHRCEEEGEEENMKSGQGEQQGVKTETQKRTGRLSERGSNDRE